MIEIRPGNGNSQKKKSFITVIIITLIGNLVLAVGKGWIASITGSAALYSDAANSISDVVYSILVAIGLFIAMQPPDRSHPQGHSRFEPLVGLAVTAAMSIAAYESGRNAIEKIIAGPQSIPLSLPVFILIASALIKALMFFFVRKIGKKHSSPSLRTIAVDNLTDIFTSVGAFLGILASNWLAPIVDPIAGLLVSIWIMIAAFKSGKENLAYLTGATAPAAIKDDIRRSAEEIEGVVEVHHLITEYVGPNLIVDMHVTVSDQLQFPEAHKINDLITEAVEQIPEVDRAYVHLEPSTDL